MPTVRDGGIRSGSGYSGRASCLQAVAIWALERLPHARHFLDPNTQQQRSALTGLGPVEELLEELLLFGAIAGGRSLNLLAGEAQV
ncbi:MAG: hypothetical protein RLZ98_2296 [Pseudomonadota bacterium]